MRDDVDMVLVVGWCDKHGTPYGVAVCHETPIVCHLNISFVDRGMSEEKPLLYEVELDAWVLEWKQKFMHEFISDLSK